MALQADDDVGDPQQSMADFAYRRISDKILSGDYPAGFRLRERELSDDLDISRIPIRESLHQLEADGFIVTYPRRGAVVREFTVSDAEELFDIRLNLEVFAARKAAEFVAAGGVAPRLAELQEESASATAREDIAAVAALNSALHAEIIAMSGNTLLATAMRPVLGRLQRLFALASDRDPQAQCTEHAGLCAAIYAGKPELAAALAYAHIELGREPSLAGLATALTTGHKGITQ
ncbi:GntR family transcriptional regulator [Paenarthrobacter sp. PH39-S1]|uniref:GntR family transcriptional regulator n=1 Tax=Paenarthrobacter sp. PH39-S1 TaxID=3046204 RepID=UPI0024B8EC51|nr:GntR family transcriptional regulator [Paenarthrobacter sp. PH39-S1]MDJ0357859.1 GntR family transcriptional regulator [Paenarthrobacter sp. PH39-S1]